MAACLANRSFVFKKEILGVIKLLYCRSDYNLRNERVFVQCLRHKSRGTKDSLSSIIQPLKVTPVTKTSDDIIIGEELTGTLKKGEFT